MAASFEAWLANVVDFQCILTIERALGAAS
jgi:hypothetical protein